MNQYPRLTSEFMSIAISNVTGGALIAYTTGVTFTVTDPLTQPDSNSVWVATVSGPNSTIGLIVPQTGQGRGTYRVWAKVVTSNEAAIIDCDLYAVM